MEIINVYQDKEIEKYILSKVKKEEVEEIKQNSILKLLKVKNIERIENLKNYYFIIVKNEINKYYKKKSKNSYVELSEEIKTVDDDIFLEVREIKENYPLLYEFYYLGLSVKELKKKYKLEKSSLYNKIKEEKERIRSDWDV